MTTSIAPPGFFYHRGYLFRTADNTDSGSEISEPDASLTGTMEMISSPSHGTEVQDPESVHFILSPDQVPHLASHQQPTDDENSSKSYFSDDPADSDAEIENNPSPLNPISELERMQAAFQTTTIGGSSSPVNSTKPD